jgi:hypothetical protein
MQINKEVDVNDVMVAKLAVAYTLLALAPYDRWGHEGDPAEMAAYVVETARKKGNLLTVQQALGINISRNPDENYSRLH